MWICLNNSFLSIVAHHDDPALLLVRARNPEHITAVFPEATVYVRKGSDYGWRADVNSVQVAEAISKRVLDIDYTNFKNSVKDDELHDAYAGFWTIMYRYQGHVSRMIERIKMVPAKKAAAKKAPKDDTPYFTLR